MKNIFRFSMMLAFAAALFCGCSDREVMPGVDDEPITGGDTTVGYIVLSDGGLIVEFDGESVSDSEKGGSRATRAEKPAVNDLWIEIVDTQTEQPAVERFKYGNRGSNPIEVPLGSYYVRAYSGDSYDLPEGVTSFWENDRNPSWAGQSASFYVTREHTETKPYAVEKITCKMQTVKVTVVLEKALAERFTANKTFVTVAIQESDFYDANQPMNSVVYENDSQKHHQYGLAELDPDKDYAIKVEERPSDISHLAVINKDGGNAMFVHLETEFLQTDGKTMELTSDITIAGTDAGVLPGQWRKIILYLEENEETGRVVIGAKIETWVYDEEVTVDESSAVARIGESKILDYDTSKLSLSSSGDLTLDGVSEVKSFTSSGEYTGSAAMDINLKTGSKFDKFVVSISSDNNNFKDFLKDNNLNYPIDIVDANFGTTTTIEGLGFPKQSDLIAGKSFISFDLKPLIEMAYKYGNGTHTVTFNIESGDYYYSAVMKLNINVSGGGSDTPPSGDGPSIVWRGGKDFEERYDTITESGEPLEVKIDMYAPAGIQKLLVHMSGALEDGLKGLMPTDFDVAHTEESGDENLASTLKTFQFPVNEEVRNKTYLEFDITGFMSMLGSFYGDSDFQLTVIDKNNQSVTRTIKLHVKDEDE